MVCSIVIVFPIAIVFSMIAVYPIIIVFPLIVVFSITVVFPIANFHPLFPISQLSLPFQLSTFFSFLFSARYRFPFRILLHPIVFFFNYYRPPITFSFLPCSHLFCSPLLFFLSIDRYFPRFLVSLFFPLCLSAKLVSRFLGTPLGFLFSFGLLAIIE